MEGPARPWIRYREHDLVRVELWFPGVDRWERCVLMGRAEARRVIARRRAEVTVFRRIHDPAVARARLIRYLVEIAGTLVVRTRA